MGEIHIEEVGLTPGYQVVKYPFIRETVSLIGEDGPYESQSWRPGTRFEYGPYDAHGLADGEGHMMLTVVGVYRPNGFPARVFYTRKFSDPDGRVFGKNSLRICTLEKFRRISSRFAYAYEMPLALGDAA